jgi:broad specificity phosphatase PhoE
VETRTSQFLQEVITKKQNALIVSHGVAILTMLRYVLNIPKEHVRTLRVENLGLVKLDADSSGISFSIINPSHLFPATNVPRKKTEAEADI